jgi:hypothetical protein
MIASLYERKHVENPEGVVKSAASDGFASSDRNIEYFQAQRDHLYRNVLTEEA